MLIRVTRGRLSHGWSVHREGRVLRTQGRVTVVSRFVDLKSLRLKKENKGSGSLRQTKNVHDEIYDEI